MEDDVERMIVCDALALMRRHVEERHKNAISKLPRNGKSAATASDDANEQEVADHIKKIDTILTSYLEAKGKSVVGSQRQSSPTILPHTYGRPTSVTLDDSEPYINPFTGLWVIPDHHDQPGPSGTSNGSPPALTGSQLGSIVDEEPDHPIDFSTSSGSQKLPVAARETKPQTPSLAPVTMHARSATSSPEVASCDALWEAFGIDPLELEQQRTSSWTNTVSSLSFGSISPDAPQNIPSPTEDSPQTAADREYIERSLQEFEDRLKSQGLWKSEHMEVTKRGEPVSQSSDVLRATFIRKTKSPPSLQDQEKALPDSPADKPDKQRQDISQLDHRERLDLPKGDQVPWHIDQENAFLTDDWDRADQERQSQFELDRQGALELAEDIPQDYQELSQAQANVWTREREQIQAIQDEIHRRDQEEIEVIFTQMRRMQEEWNRETDEILQQEQGLARQIAEQEEQKERVAMLKEMRRMQEQMQAEENQRFEDDLKLARAIAEMEDQGGNGHVGEEYYPQAWIEPSPYTDIRPAPGGWVDQDESTSTPPTTATPQSHNPFRRIKKNPPIDLNQITSPVLTPEAIPAPRPSTSRSSSKRQTTQDSARAPQIHDIAPTGSTISASDMEVISNTLSATQKLRNQWSDEVQKNEAAARAAQQEAKRIEEQARRDMERLRREKEQRRQAEQKRQEEERKAQLARMADCSVCSESAEKDQMCRLACKHYYCRGCLLRSMQGAVKDKKTFKCCKKPVNISAVSRFIPPQVTTAYTALTEELATPNPTYCHNRRCSAFIPPASYRGDVASCPRCNTETCRLCKKGVHQGVCKQDAAGQALLNLGNRKKWAQCPHCKTMVERSAGCLHMTCRCGTNFCYNCGKQNCSGESCTRR